MYLADAAVFLSCAMSLAVFNIAKCVESGKVVEPIDDCTNGAVVYALFFLIGLLQLTEPSPATPCHSSALSLQGRSRQGS